MKAVAYNIKDFERELLALANAKMHDLTLISNPLKLSTIHYAHGKEVVIVSGDDLLDAEMLDALKSAGVKKVVTRSLETDHIDLSHAKHLHIQIANAPYPNRTAKGIAEQTIRNLNLWDAGRCIGLACCCSGECDTAKEKQKTNDEDKR